MNERIAQLKAALQHEQQSLEAWRKQAAALPPRDRWIEEQNIDSGRHDRAKRWQAWEEEIKELEAQQ